MEINQAIDALSGGSSFSDFRGTIVILDGEYHLNGQLSLLNGISLIGTGGTKLVRETSTPNYMIGVLNGSIRNIIYDGNSRLFQSGPSSVAEIILSRNGSVMDCQITDFHNIAISTETGNFVSPSYIQRNVIGSLLGNGRVGVNVTNSSLVYIENNIIFASENMVLVDGTDTVGGVQAETYILWNSDGAGGNGIIYLDKPEACQIVGNSCRKIVVENTSGAPQSLGAVITQNQFRYSNHLDGPFISLGENTSWNIVSENLMHTTFGTGTIQDNGSNNLVVNNITGD